MKRLSCEDEIHFQHSATGHSLRTFLIMCRVFFSNDKKRNPETRLVLKANSINQPAWKGVTRPIQRLVLRVLCVTGVL